MGGIQTRRPHPEERAYWRASRRMATGDLACGRPSRRAQQRAPLDEADEWCRYGSNLGNAPLNLERVDRLVQAVRQVFFGPILRLYLATKQHACGAYALPARIEGRRLLTLFQRRCRFVQKSPCHDNRAVGRQQLFVLVILNRPHTLLQRCVLDGKSEHAAVGAPVFLRAAIDEIIVILVGQRPERAAGLIGAVDTFAFCHGTTLLLRQRLAGMEVDAPCPAIVVFVWNAAATTE